MLVVVIAVDASRAHRELPRVAALRARRRSPRTRCTSRRTSPGSVAVLVGLLLVRGRRARARTPSAALFVAALVVVAALRLARQSIDVLMDRSGARGRRAHPRRARQARRARGAAPRARAPGGRAPLRRPRGGRAARHRRDARRTRSPTTSRSVVERALGGRRRGRARGADARPRATSASAPPPPRGAFPEVREVHNVRVMRLPDGYELSLHVKLPRELSLDGGARRGRAAGGARSATRCRSCATCTRTSSRSRAPTGRSTPPTRRHRHRARGDRVGGAALHGRRPLDVTFRDGEQGRVALVTVEPPGRAAAALRAPARRARSRRPCASAARRSPT